jgi:hypothetical protein
MALGRGAYPKLSTGMWIMNLETIKSEQFIKHASKMWWDNWKIEKYKYSAIGYGGILRKTK